MYSQSVETTFKEPGPDSSTLSASSEITAIYRFNQFLSELEKKYPRSTLEPPKEQKVKNFSFGVTSPTNFHSIKEEVEESDTANSGKSKGIQILKQVAQSVYSRRKSKEKEKQVKQTKYHTNESIQSMLDRLSMEDKKREHKIEQIKMEIEKENQVILRNTPEINSHSSSLGNFVIKLASTPRNRRIYWKDLRSLKRQGCGSRISSGKRKSTRSFQIYWQSQTYKFM